MLFFPQNVGRVFKRFSFKSNFWRAGKQFIESCWKNVMDVFWRLSTNNFGTKLLPSELQNKGTSVILFLSRSRVLRFVKHLKCLLEITPRTPVSPRLIFFKLLVTFWEWEQKPVGKVPSFVFSRDIVFRLGKQLKKLFGIVLIFVLPYCRVLSDGSKETEFAGHNFIILLILEDDKSNVFKCSFRTTPASKSNKGLLARINILILVCSRYLNTSLTLKFNLLELRVNSSKIGVMFINESRKISEMSVGLCDICNLFKFLNDWNRPICKNCICISCNVNVVSGRRLNGNKSLTDMFWRL